MSEVVLFQPRVTQNRFRSVRSAQEYLWTTAMYWESEVQELVDYPIGSSIPPELKDRVRALSIQLITAQQSFEECQKRLQNALDLCDGRRENGDLFLAPLPYGDSWVCSHRDPSHNQYPLKNAFICTIKSWDDLTWQWVSASFSNVFAVIDTPSGLVGKTPKYLWGEHAVAIERNDRQVKATDDLRIYHEPLPINGELVSRIAIRFPVSFASVKYVATLAFDSIDYPAWIAL